MYDALHIPGYRIEKLLASGAMGTVFSAIQTSINARRAVKILHPHLAHDERFLARFEEEARNAARVHGEHVVGIVDFSRTNDPPFLAMEFVDGPTLETILKRVRPFPIELAVLILRQLAMGLETAHRRNVVHRDLKPSNVMITRDGRVKVADFGLAKTMTDSVNLTMPGQRLGTLAYMSPEQINSPTDVDFRSDLFSFGIMAYQLLVGARPFRGNDSDTLQHSILNEKPPSPRERTLLVDRDVSDFVMQLLHKNPARRPAEIGWAREWLEHYVAMRSLFTWQDRLRDFVNDPESVSAEQRRRDAHGYAERARLLLKLGEERAPDAFRELAIALYLCPDDIDALQLKPELLATLRRLDISPSDVIPEPMASALEDSGLDLWEEWERGSSSARFEDSSAASETAVLEAPEEASATVLEPTPEPDGVASDTVLEDVQKTDVPDLPAPPAGQAPGAEAAPSSPAVPGPSKSTPRAAEARAPVALERRRERREGQGRRIALATAVLAVGVAIASGVLRLGGDDTSKGATATTFLTAPDVFPSEADLDLSGPGDTGGTRRASPGMRIGPLEPGVYTLRATAPGFRTFSRTLDLPGGSVDGEIRLVPRAATLGVTSVPPGARILLSGTPVGTTPLDRLETRQLGRSTMRLELAGFVAWESTLTIEDGAIVNVKAVLSRMATGPFRLTIVAPGLSTAQLLVDGRSRGDVRLPHELELEPRHDAYSVSLERTGWTITPRAAPVVARSGQTIQQRFAAECEFGYITVLGGLNNPVSIDGQTTYEGTRLVTPLKELRLPCKPGGYEIRVVRGDEPSASQRVEIRPGEIMRVRFDD